MIKNLTPHSIVLVSPDGVSTTTIPPEAVSARVKNKPGCAVVDSPFGELCYDYTADTSGEIEGLPDAEEGFVLVVSGQVGAALIEKGILRRDVRVPGTGPDDEAVREPATLQSGEKNPRGGQIKAVTRLKRIC